MNASKGLVAKPSTETVKNQDDFAARNAFSVVDCNFVISDDEKRTVTAVSGDYYYRSTGAVDCGVMTPMTYWGWEDAEDYYIVHFSDKPNEAVGCTTPTPWCDEELGYGIVTKYYAGKINGLLYSSSGNAIFNFVSAQSGNTELQKRGAGYKGSGSERIAYLLCMMWIKYATKNIQTVFKGNSDNNVQVKVAEAGENVNYWMAWSIKNRQPGDRLELGLRLRGSQARGDLVALVLRALHLTPCLSGVNFTE